MWRVWSTKAAKLQRKIKIREWNRKCPNKSERFCGSKKQLNFYDLGRSWKINKTLEARKGKFRKINKGIMWKRNQESSKKTLWERRGFWKDSRKKW